MNPQENIVVVGLGYVGCVTAACLAQLGHRVVGVDRDEHKVRNVLGGHAPFFEPGLEALVSANVRAGRLSATTKLEEALPRVGMILLCVGTPSAPTGDLGLEQVERSCTEIAAALGETRASCTLVVRSTIFPGTCERVVAPALGGKVDAIVANPEFLREGTAIRDFTKPSLTVVGGDDPEAVQRVAALYEPLGVEIARVGLRTAEMIKYACNAFHALKISFANEIGTLAASLGVDGAEVMHTLCRDTGLNVSRAYLKPGFAFGGSCLPKDLRTLRYRARHLDLELPLVESILTSNGAHLDRAAEAVLNLPPQRLGIFGLAFKADTDDVRESPTVRLLETLIGKGRELRVFDPHIRLEWIYGTNERFLINAVPHIHRLMVPDLEALLEWAERLIITQTPSPEARARILQRRLPILDLTTCEKQTAVAAA